MRKLRDDELKEINKKAYEDELKELYRNYNAMRLTRDNAPKDQYDELDAYVKAIDLYIGRIMFKNGLDYYITKTLGLKSRIFGVGKNDSKIFRLISALDNEPEVREIYEKWRDCQENDKFDDVKYVRKIEMAGPEHLKKLDYAVSFLDDPVKVVFDNENNGLSGIEDEYLRMILIRNKDKEGFADIINTIQKNQDKIRMESGKVSFIVQGCAGSGKTSVLLARIKQLLHNKSMVDDDYILLVPHSIFKSYLVKTSLEFGIKNNNIVSIVDYYKYLCGQLNLQESKGDGVVYSSEFLKTVYSEKFIKECYDRYFCNLKKLVNEYVRMVRDKFYEKLREEQKTAECEVTALIKQLRCEIKNEITDIEPFISVHWDNIGIDSIDILVADVRDKLKKCQKNYEEQYKTNQELKELDLHINEVRKNLEATPSAYVGIRAAYENIIEQLKKLYKERKDKLPSYFGRLSVEKVTNILQNVCDLRDKMMPRIEERKAILAKWDEYVYNEKYKKYFEQLVKAIEMPAVILFGDDYRAEYIDNLNSSDDYVCKRIKKLINLDLLSFMKVDEKNSLLEGEFKIFASFDEEKLRGNLAELFMDSCRQDVENNYGLKLTEGHKCYWFLNAYGHYLCGCLPKDKKKFVFVDEAQDLGVVAIDLIRKVNTLKNEQPIFNLFGDVYQTITPYGITDWNGMGEISDIRILNQNFRNSDEIVDYCNRKHVLPKTMEKVGVSAESVGEFANFKQVYAIPENKLKLSSKSVFVVNDADVEQKALQLLKNYGCKNYLVYTIGEVKGLEFPEVFVFDCGMDTKEKYIAYTRALRKLNVIHTL